MTTHPRSPRLVGRAAEADRLDAAAACAVDGRVATLLVSGEAGVGKTRLVEDAVTRHEATLRVLTGGCAELAAVPFAPFVGALRAVGGELDDGARARLAPLLPGLSAPSPVVPSEDARPRLFEGVLALLAQRPTLLVVEDAHWADRSTLDLLDYLIANQQAAPGSLVVVTHRSDEPNRPELRSFLAGALRRPWTDRVDLARLSRSGVAAQVAAILDGPADPALVTAVHTRSEGNPLFVEALLVEPDADVPGSLADLLATRVERLGPEAAATVRAAGVGGLRVAHALLDAVAGPLDGALRSAVAAGALVVDGDGYRFRHALVRDAVLRDLLPGERVALHGRYAAALATPGPGVDADCAALAWHLRAAGDARGALPPAVRAAAAHRGLAYAEGEDLLEQVLAVWDTVVDAARLAGTDRLAVLEQAAEAAARAGENERGERLADLALARPEAAGQQVRTASLHELRYRLRSRNGCDEAGEDLRAALDTIPPGHPIRPYLLNVLAGHLLDRPDPDGARGAAEAALTAACASGDDPAEAGALITLATLDARLGDLDAQLPRLRRARAIAEGVGAHRLRLRALDNESHLLHAYGRLVEAERVARDGVRAADEAGLSRSAGPAHAVNLVAALTSAGRWDEALESAEHALALVPPVNDHGHLLALRAVVALHRGEPDLAERLVARADELVADAFCQDPLLLPRLRAEMLAARGQESAAAGDVAAILRRDRLTETSRFTWPVLVLAARLGPADDALPELLEQVLARMPAATPPQVAAARTVAALREPTADAWTAAVTAWEAIGHPFELAEALVGRVDALLPDRRDHAAEDLRRAREIAVGLGAAPLVAQVDDLARRARLPVPPGTRSPSRHGLTPREGEVLALVAAGLGNAEIGERLFISTKTASVHVSNILGKLGAANRVEAAATAHRLGLVPV